MLKLCPFFFHSNILSCPFLNLSKMGLFADFYTIKKLEITPNVNSFAWEIWKTSLIMEELLRHPKSGKVGWAFIKYLDFSPKGSDHRDTIRMVKYWLFVLFVIRKCGQKNYHYLNIFWCFRNFIFFWYPKTNACYYNFRLSWIWSWTQSKQLRSWEGVPQIDD